LRAEWEAQVGSFVEEDFTGGVLEDFSISTAGTFQNGFDTTGQLTDRLASGSSTTITFDFEIYAFGGNWDLSFRGAGLGIQVNAGGVMIPIEIPHTHAGEFFGFTSDFGFTELVLAAGSQSGGPEKYTADDFVYAAYAPRLDPAPDPDSTRRRCRCRSPEPWPCWCWGSSVSACGVAKPDRPGGCPHFHRV
jgi:hypothetical protein